MKSYKSILRLSRKKLAQLRSEIILNSLFIRDYKNTLDIDPSAVCDFFDGFYEYIWELAEEEKTLGEIIDHYTVLERYDNIDNLVSWQLCHAC